MTTRLLLADPSPPADGAEAAAEDGPLGELRRRLTLLQGPQVLFSPQPPPFLIPSLYVMLVMATLASTELSSWATLLLSLRAE